MHSMPHVLVETCESPRVAAAKLAEGHYHAAITDLVMPDLDGFSVLAYALAARPCTPILLCTGKKDIVLAERAFRQGAFDFVPKPLNRDWLIWSLNLAIKTHRLRRRIEERRVYVAQLREVLTRRWEKPLSVQAAHAVESSQSLTGASFDRAEAAVRQSEKLIERADNDSDGKLTLAEFIADVNARFALVDGDKNGSLTPAEMLIPMLVS